MIITTQAVEQRQEELQAEIAKGHQQLEALEQRRLEIEQTMLRLSGAVQVLNELLDTSAPSEVVSGSNRLAAAG